MGNNFNKNYKKMEEYIPIDDSITIKNKLKNLMNGKVFDSKCIKVYPDGSIQVEFRLDMKDYIVKLLTCKVRSKKQYKQLRKKILGKTIRIHCDKYKNGKFVIYTTFNGKSF